MRCAPGVRAAVSSGATTARAVGRGEPLDQVSGGPAQVAVVEPHDFEQRRQRLERQTADERQRVRGAPAEAHIVGLQRGAQAALDVHPARRQGRERLGGTALDELARIAEAVAQRVQLDGAGRGGAPGERGDRRGAGLGRARQQRRAT